MLHENYKMKIFVHVGELPTAQVFAADLYVHSVCMKKDIRKYKNDVKECLDTTNHEHDENILSPKLALVLQCLHILNPLSC